MVTIVHVAYVQLVGIFKCSARRENKYGADRGVRAPALRRPRQGQEGQLVSNNKIAVFQYLKSTDP